MKLPGPTKSDWCSPDLRLDLSSSARLAPRQSLTSQPDLHHSCSERYCKRTTRAYRMPSPRQSLPTSAAPLPCVHASQGRVNLLPSRPLRRAPRCRLLPRRPCFWPHILWIARVWRHVQIVAGVDLALSVHVERLVSVGCHAAGPREHAGLHANYIGQRSVSCTRDSQACNGKHGACRHMVCAAYKR